MSEIPVSSIDIYSDAEILEPYETYAEYRRLGPVVYMSAHDIYALPRYADVKRALLDHRLFSSAAGIAANNFVNNFRPDDGVSTTIQTDPPYHTVLRQIIAAPLQPTAIASLQATIQAAADDLIDRLVTQQRFDGMRDLARFLPVMIVSRLVGLPEEGRQNMLDWAAATFELLGPMNARAQAALPKFQEMISYTVDHAKPQMVVPGSWAARIYEAVGAGKISMPQAITLLIDYLGPSLDTTIFATGHLLMLLGRNPQTWDDIRADPTLVSGAIEECVRLESPIRGFTRKTTADCEIDGVRLAEGSRVLVMYASANRDDRKWERPDAFDIRRDTSGHLGFGLGRHGCAGMHLARLEMTSILRAMVRRIERFEVGEPVRAFNNVLRGIDQLPVTITKTAVA